MHFYACVNCAEAEKSLTIVLPLSSQLLARNGPKLTAAGRILLKDLGFGRTKNPWGGEGVGLRIHLRTVRIFLYYREMLFSARYFCIWRHIFHCPLIFSLDIAIREFSLA